MGKQQNALAKYNLRANRKINGWTLSKKLGSGGNGEVWMCKNEKKEEYAIKFFKFGRYGAAYERFVDEVLFMEQHQEIHGVLPIIDKNLPSKNQKNVDANIPIYYVMPLAESVEQKIKNFTLDEKVEVIQMLLNMLVNLHQNGIAHRDIKPANILYYNGKFVLSDFGLVYFKRKKFKTPVGKKVGAKQTIAPQMEKDAQSADRYKADVYSMAKTIWIILTGDEFSFGGQYIANSEIGLSRKLKCNKYLYPLDKLLAQCTDYTESTRPTAEEMKNKFEEWIQINKNWSKGNLMQWKEIQEQLFPTIIPTHAEWKNVEDVVNVLRLLGKYESLNHMFFPDDGGMDLTDASISYEQGCIELRCGAFVYIIKPRFLSFENINESIEWNYFFLQADPMPAITQNMPKDKYFEEFYETSPLEYLPLSENNKIVDDNGKAIETRHIIRYLKGSFVLFHKDSIYNHIISKYRGEHEKMGFLKFREGIFKLEKRFRGETMETIWAKNKQNRV